MTEAEQRRQESPLLSDRGVTTIKDTVVARIAGMAAGEVEGVHMGGNASRSAGGLLEGITGSDSPTRGVSVEVGSVEAAIDLKMGIDYGKNILGTVGEVRQKITERVQTFTGLKISELNVTISDVTFPEEGQGDKEGNGSTSGTRTGPDTRTMPRTELRPGASERETTEVEPRSRTHTEGASGPVPEEEVRAEGTPVEEDETRRLRVGDEEPSGGATGTSTDDAATTREEASGAPTSGTGASGTPGDETSAGDTDEGTQEIDRGRVSEAEERRTRRRRRREERGEDEEG
ncbi:MAG: Asp23/Gls24 family envelope stress response protein [Rubrobacter sp.]|jgi:uncharacterized alkaline shock family protein YloU|nr:Asp23/Gls24 family envelope stress response protein [Rubrobacter sp.]MBA3951001.1 Asp23/Gls24 family envelope stress response protein [Rubrobacter sp.]MDQ3377027.1 Asp23/Gls24 family envelope stress response protein [Actinomycetota bacterium]